MSIRLVSRVGLVVCVVALLLFLAGYQLAGAGSGGHVHGLNSAEFIAYTVCHRLPTHSFTILGRPMPLCARCSGIYLGILLAFSMTWLTQRQRFAHFPRWSVAIPLIALFLWMALDGLNSLFHDLGLTHAYEPNNTLRLITGFGAGLAIASVTTTVFAQTAWREPQWTPQLASIKELSIQIGLAITLILLILSNQPTILYVLALGSAVGVLVILSFLYATLLLIVTRKDGTIDRNRQIALPLALGSVCAAVQIMLIASLRFNLTGTWSGF